MDSPSGPAAVAAPSQRILSVDALRGFDMFWLIGGSSFVAAVLQFCGPTARKYLLPQLEHVHWEGFAFEDLIFPLFVFMVGMSTVFSLSRHLAEQGKAAAYRRLIRRAVVLYLLGIFYYGGLSHTWPNIRLLGVLQRIALCYLFAGIIFIHLRTRGIVITLFVLLIGYWAWLSFVPVPGVENPTPAAQFAEKTNWANYIDEHFLPGKRWNGTWDPEGLLSTLPAIGTCLLGVLAALLLRNPATSTRARLGWLLGGGLLCLLLGFAWGGQIEALVRYLSGNQGEPISAWGYPFPVIKKIWTSSYVLVAGGYSLILLGLFHLVIDVWKVQRWAAPFFWIGANAITLYMACNIISFGALARRLVGGEVQYLCITLFGAAAGKDVGELLLATAGLGMTLAIAWFLYRRNIFIRV